MTAVFERRLVMPEAQLRLARRRSLGGILWLSVLLAAGCKSQKQPVYEDGRGLHFEPPPGWVERARDDALRANTVGRQQPALPLPPLGAPGRQQERFLVRYDRISTPDHAWLRVTVAEVSSATPLQACLASCRPGRDWKLETEEESLEVSGLPAAGVVFAGRCYDRDYLCETVAVRKGEMVYLFCAALPASDDAGREQVRQAVLRASWEK
jgi:hypothetical protein